MIHFDRCAPYLAAALVHDPVGGFSLDDVRERCADGRMQFWPGRRFAMVTQVMEYPRLKALQVFLLGGDFKEYSTVHEHVVAWAREQGCTKLISGGRHGWLRHAGLKRLGATTTDFVAMQQEL